MLKVSRQQVRRLILSQQGLLRDDQFGRGSNAVQNTLNQLQYVQIDTISVVDRAHHHVLKSRVSNYTPAMLDQLHNDKRSVFEYWFHAAAYLPMTDYRFYLPLMQGFSNKRKADAKLIKEIMARVRIDGTVQARDFEHLSNKKSSGWWDWKPAKRALEFLYLSGELMIKERRGFQKVYDLTENCLPSHVDCRTPDDVERGVFYVQRMLTAQGIATAKEIAYPRAIVKHFSGHDIQPGINKALLQLEEAGVICPVKIEQQSGRTSTQEPDKEIHYCLSSILNNQPRRLAHKRVVILSPFDNLVINRKRLSKLFDFDYQIECYVPAPKRKFGYFVQPILYGDELIGRMDCKADRQRGILQIHNIWLEHGVTLTDELHSQLRQGLSDYCMQLGCDTWNINGSLQLSVTG